MSANQTFGAFDSLRRLFSADISGLRTMHIVRASITTVLFVTALSISPAAANAKPTTPLAAYAGTWAPSAEQCKIDPTTTLNQRLAITADGLSDGRAPDVDCTVEKIKTHPDGLNVGLICQIGQESPFNFRTDYTILRKSPRTIAITNSFVDRKPETLDYVRCAKAVLPNPSARAPTGAPASSQYTLPPLAGGEYYEGQPYRADYDERRAELLGAKAKPLARRTHEVCTQPFCRKYPEIRACYDNGAYCVGRWERADSATVDYVVKPDTLEVLNIVCRDTCGVDEIQRPAR
ncbi:MULTISPECIES: hypothetical protein [Methylobacterium]|uniref:hypothetical protein n=1 Tax=Methylobacterium TaxID=407 RepID=UPI001F2010B4|nr:MULTISPECIES: hypothetical protein [Methylobacterium]MCF4124929.1 hypothetical protein [Methylobacterium sp. SyP6R]